MLTLRMKSIAWKVVCQKVDASVSPCNSFHEARVHEEIGPRDFCQARSPFAFP